MAKCEHCKIMYDSIHFFQKAHSIIHPEFCKLTTADTKVSQNGNFVFMSSQSKHKFGQPLSVEYFGHLRACMLRGHFHLEISS